MMRVEDILMVKGPDVIVASLTTTVWEATKLMAEGKVGSIIVRNGKSVHGIFTERDLLIRVVAANKNPLTTILADVMSSPVQGCRLSDSIRECAKRLAEGHIRHMAVVEDGALVGLISLRDVLAAELESREQEIRDLQAVAEN